MISLLAWLLSTVIGGVMALPDLEDHFATHGVDPGLSSQLIQSGWTSQNFSVIVDSLAGFRSYQKLLYHWFSVQT